MKTLGIDSDLVGAFDGARDDTGHGTTPARVHGRGEARAVSGGEEQHGYAVGRLDGGQDPVLDHNDCIRLRRVCGQRPIRCHDTVSVHLLDERDPRSPRRHGPAIPEGGRHAQRTEGSVRVAPS